MQQRMRSAAAGRGNGALPAQLLQSDACCTGRRGAQVGRAGHRRPAKPLAAARAGALAREPPASCAPCVLRAAAHAIYSARAASAGEDSAAVDDAPHAIALEAASKQANIALLTMKARCSVGLSPRAMTPSPSSRTLAAAQCQAPE